MRVERKLGIAVVLLAVLIFGGLLGLLLAQAFPRISLPAMGICVWGEPGQTFRLYLSPDNGRTWRLLAHCDWVALGLYGDAGDCEKQRIVWWLDSDERVVMPYWVGPCRMELRWQDTWTGEWKKMRLRHGVWYLVVRAEQGEPRGTE